MRETFHGSIFTKGTYTKRSSFPELELKFPYKLKTVVTFDFAQSM